jgi:hypothetical protein
MPNSDPVPNPSALPEGPTWAVVVIHGVGDTGPGVTLEAFVPPFAARSNGNLVEDEPPEVRLLPDPNPEVPSGRRATLDERFPMALRRARVGQPRAGTPGRVLFAEVFWADVSAAGESLWDLLIRLFSVVFDLRFLADRAAAHKNLPPARWLRFLLWWAAWLVGGPIAALCGIALYLLAARFVQVTLAHWIEVVFPAGSGNLGMALLGGLALAVGLGLSLWSWKANWGWLWSLIWECLAVIGAGVAALALGGAADAPWGWDAALCGLGLLGACLGALLWQRGRRANWGQTWTWVLGWLSLTSAGLAGFAAFRALVPGGWSWDSWAGQFVTSRLSVESVPEMAPDRFFEYLAVLLCVTQAAYVVLAFVMALALVAWLAARRQAAEQARRAPRYPGDEGAVPALDAAIGSSFLQIGLWVVIVPALGLLALSRLDPDLRDSLFSRVLTSFLLHLFFGVAVAAFALWVWVKCALWVRRHPPPYDTPEGRQRVKELPRLLVYRRLLLFLVALSFVGSLAFAVAFIANVTWVHNLLKDPAPRVAAVVVPLILIVGTFFQKGLRSWLHVLMDVVSHFFMTRLPLPSPLKDGGEFRMTDCVIQQRIEGRFRRVLEEVLKLANVTHLTVVSHSQGTVIAIDLLCLGGTLRLLEGHPVREVNLVTMGSPFTYLYQYYFPNRYPPLFDDPEARVFNTKGWFALRRAVHRWLNAYRVDDFIGTHIDGDGSHNAFPVNHPLDTGRGHTGYWYQPEVLDAVKPYLPGA